MVSVLEVVRASCAPLVVVEARLRLAEVMLAKKHYAFFDCAYQGFASGDLDQDAWAVRYFVEKGVALLVCQVGQMNFKDQDGN